MQNGGLRYGRESVSLLLHLGLEIFACGEAHALGRLDFDLLLGLRIGSNARLARGYFEGAETDQLDGLVFLETAFDAVDDCFDCPLCCCAGGFFAEVFLNGCDEVSFVHGVVLT